MNHATHYTFTVSLSVLLQQTKITKNKIYKQNNKYYNAKKKRYITLPRARWMQHSLYCLGYSDGYDKGKEYIHSRRAGRGGCSASVTLSGIWDITKRRGLGRRAAVIAVFSMGNGFQHQLSLHQRLLALQLRWWVLVMIVYEKTISFGSLYAAGCELTD